MANKPSVSRHGPYNHLKRSSKESSGVISESQRLLENVGELRVPNNYLMAWFAVAHVALPVLNLAAFTYGLTIRLLSLTF